MNLDARQFMARPWSPVELGEVDSDKRAPTAADVMTIDVISVTPETPLREIAKLMCTKRISGVPVVDQENRIIGIVSEADLIGHVKIVGERRPSWWLSAFVHGSLLAREFAKTHGRTAGDVMTPDVITVAPTASVAEIATILEQHRIKRVPVVEDGKLVGIVTRSNLLQGLVTADVAKPASRDDRAIREWLLALLETQRWAHLPSKNIVVQNGVVHLWGVVETEDERHALRLAAENVPGVKRVKDHTRTRPLFRLG